LDIGIWILPFDFAQGGELIEPFVICDLELGISLYSGIQLYVDILFDLINVFVGHDTALCKM